MTGTCQSLTALFGRILLSAIFLISGFAKITDWSGTAGHMEKAGMVAIPLFLVGAIVLEIGGGLSVHLGWFTRIGTVALVVFLVAATLVFHNFWAYDGAERTQQMINFMKNLAIMGGLLTLMAFGPGRYSVDGRCCRVGESRLATEREEHQVVVG
jgi:putative oxidoreductase